MSEQVEGGSSSLSQLEPRFLDTAQGRKLAYRQLDGDCPGVLFIHGLASTMAGQKSSALYEHCREIGKSYVCFDLSGHGQSSGSLQEATVSAWLEDVTAVLDAVTKGPQVIVGSSLGGWLMFLYTMRNPENVKGLVGIATAADFTHGIWKSLEPEQRREVKLSGVYHMTSPYSPSPIPISLELIQDGEKYSILDMPGIELISVPTWLLHGELDTVQHPTTSIQLLQKLQCPVTLRTVEDGDHRLSRPQDINLLLQALNELLNPELAKSAADLED